MDLVEVLRERLTELSAAEGLLLVGASGGSDSTALVLGLSEAGFDIVVAHLDHQLREDSQADARFVAELAGRLGVPFIDERVNVAAVATRRGWNLEDAARRVRYEFLTRSARTAGALAVLTAHTLDDQAETVLMQLFRGSAYLRGMRPRRGTVVRPLLDVSRSRLEEYLREAGQPWRDDPTNLDTSNTRAWIRHRLLPRIHERFPEADLMLGRHSEIQRELESYLRQQAGRLETERGFDQSRLLNAPPALQREAIRSLFERAGVAPAFSRIEEVRAQLPRRDPYRLSVGEGRWLRLAYGRLELAETSSRRPAGAVHDESDLPEGVPAWVLQLPELQLRSRLPGDRMRLPGGSRSLARALMDRKIPREERDALTVLASGSRVLWAEGVGAAADIVDSLDTGDDSDELHMRRALALAAEAARAGELPVGAVVVRDGETIAEGRNETEARGDPTAHAELLALRRAAEVVGDWRLSACTLYVSLEPCPMCAGAVIESHTSRVVYGAANIRDGAAGSVVDLFAEKWKRRVEVRGGVLASKASRMLSSFFAERR